jgi:putative aldouronate transport system substrate-binding protein
MLKALQRTALLTSAAALAFGALTACGSNDKASSPSGSASASAPGGSAQPVELNLFVDQPWWPLKDWSGSVPEEITKKTGVKLNITVATDEKQLPLMIASGDLPDLVVTSTQITRLSDPKLAYDWESLIAKYAPDFKIAPERQAVNRAADGKIYTVKNNFSTKEEWQQNQKYALTNGADIAVRADIMEKLGNPQIKTLDDLEHLFGQVKEKFPDMLPLALTKEGTWSKGYFAMQFGAATDGFVEQDGKLIHALRTPQLENMYLYMNKLYREGYIRADNFAFKSEDQAKQLATSGKAFAYTWTTSGADQLNALTKDAGYKWIELPIKISDSFAHLRTDTGWQGVFITKNNKNPEASIKLMQFLSSEEGQQLAMWGIKGTDWNMSEDGGYPVFTYDHNDSNIQAQKGVYWWGLLAGSAVTEALGNYSPGNETTKANQELSALTTFNSAIGLVVPDPDSQEQIIETNITNMMKNEETKVFLAKSEEDAKTAYAAMVAQADKIGMAKLEKWANDKYAQVKQQFQQ